jgi:hypothetical protein
MGTYRFFEVWLLPRSLYSAGSGRFSGFHTGVAISSSTLRTVSAPILGGRVFPVSAQTATFEPMLKHYIGVTQLLVTVAAASIAFGGNNQTLGAPIVVAKLLLAWSIFYGVLFCALLLWRYDEYAQDMESYTLGWYSTIFAFGFSSLTCFMSGYLAWGWGLTRIVP